MRHLRQCLREPIPEIFEAARLLDAAVTHHLMNETALAEELIVAADMPCIRDWTESLWGKESPYIVVEEIEHAPPILPKNERIPVRMPNADERKLLHARDGYVCRFCGIPLIRKEVRKALNQLYPSAARWGLRNCDAHTALQAMWLQYDHLLPHSRGGGNELENIAVTCAPCNFARMNHLMEEVGIKPPDLSKPPSSTWDGLERLIAS